MEGVLLEIGELKKSVFSQILVFSLPREHRNARSGAGFKPIVLRLLFSSRAHAGIQIEFTERGYVYILREKEREQRTIPFNPLR